LNGTDLLEEAYDDDDDLQESMDDDDDSAEGILDIVDPLGIRRVFSGPRRAPLPTAPTPPQTRGVTSATLSTPRGTATLQLPEQVATKEALDEVAQRLHSAIEQNSRRINSVEGDIRGLTTRVSSVVSKTRRDLDQERRERRKAIARLRREESSRATTNMMMGLLTQQQLQKQLARHEHQALAATPTGVTPTTVPAGSGETAAPLSGRDNTMMLLPLLMGTGQGGAGQDSSMWMMLALVSGLGK
jgi:hypothetical protein